MENNDKKEYLDGFEGDTKTKGKSKITLKRVIITVSIVLVVIVVGVGATSIWAINQASNLDDLSKLDAQPSQDLIVTLCESVVFGNEKDISNVELNSFLVYSFEEYDKQLKEQIENGEIENISDVKVDAVAVYFHENSPSEIYAKVLYKEDVYVFSAKADIVLDSKRQEFEINILETKIGNLEIHPNIVLDVLFDNDAIKTYTDILERSETTVIAPSYIEEEFLGQTITFEIKKYEEKEGRVSILTTSASDIIGEYLTELISGIFS